MREIKFRAWDKYKKQMIFVGFHIFGEVLTFNCFDMYFKENPNPNYESQLLRPNDIILMQCTGLKDKTGKEIYEGDILKDEKRTYKTVRFSNRDCSYKAGKYFCIPPWVKECEIIGNKYENPELEVL